MRQVFCNCGISASIPLYHVLYCLGTLQDTYVRIENKIEEGGRQMKALLPHIQLCMYSTGTKAPEQCTDELLGHSKQKMEAQGMRASEGTDTFHCRDMPSVH